MRRLLTLVSVTVLLETLLYTAITPLLPQLSHQLHLTKLTAGVMTAGYPAGTLIGALPGGALAVRRGPRFTLLAGLLLVVAATVVFGLISSALALDLARFVEGAGGACVWAGGLAWVMASAPVDRRGAVMGTVLGTAIGGALLGPALGALASVTGRAVCFCALAAVTCVLVVPITRFADVEQSSEQPVSVALRALRRPALGASMWLMALPAIVSGVLNVLGPLQLHHLGAGAGVIGLVFLVMAGLETVSSPLVGRFSDRHGRMLPLRAGLLGVAVAVACFSLATSRLGLALVLILTSVPLGIFWAPVMALVSDVAATEGVDQAHAAALINLAWAAGQLTGSAGGGAAGKAFGNGAPTLAAAAMCLLTLAAVAAARVRARQAPA